MLKFASINVYIFHGLANIFLLIDVSVRNEDIFIIQSGSENMNDNIIELCIMIQAARIGSGKRITAVLPYFPYCKQSKRKGRTSITAKRK